MLLWTVWFLQAFKNLVFCQVWKSLKFVKSLMFDRILHEIYIFKSKNGFGHLNLQSISFQNLKKISCYYERFGFYSHLKIWCFVKFEKLSPIWKHSSSSSSSSTTNNRGTLRATNSDKHMVSYLCIFTDAQKRGFVEKC